MNCLRMIWVTNISMQEKSIMEIIGRVVLLIVLTCMLAGCDNQINTMQNGTATIDEARIEFEEMCTNIMEYAKNADGEAVDKYVKSYPEGWDESTVMGIFHDYNESGYPDFSYYIVPIDDKGKYYVGGIINSISLSDGKHQQTGWMVPVSFVDGSCKIDYSEKAIQLLDNVYVYPEEMRAAENDGRYTAYFSSDDLSFADTNAVIKNTFQMKVYCIWQNEDGSISLGCSIKNGTYKEVKLGQVFITVVDNDGSAVVLNQYEAKIDECVSAQSAEHTVISVGKEYLESDPDNNLSYVCFIQHDAVEN